MEVNKGFFVEKTVKGGESMNRKEKVIITSQGGLDYQLDSDRRQVMHRSAFVGMGMPEFKDWRNARRSSKASEVVIFEEAKKEGNHRQRYRRRRREEFEEKKRGQEVGIGDITWMHK